MTVPYVVLIVSARLALFDPNLEEAAMDLGLTYWGTLLRVTLPLASPALVGALLTSFTTSLDEFALSFFLTGNDTTLADLPLLAAAFPTAPAAGGGAGLGDDCAFHSAGCARRAAAPVWAARAPTR